MFAFFSDWLRLFGVAFRLARRGRLIPPAMRRGLPLAARGLLAITADPFVRPERRGEVLADALQKLGPAYIKFGQLLATRPDITGIGLARDLSYLKDALPPFPVAAAQKTLVEEFAEEAPALFPKLGEAVAAASVAQVHRVETPEGSRAIKLLRPRIERTIERELRALTRAARAAEFLVPASRRLEPVAFIRTVGEAMRKELDLRIEAAATSEFAAIAAADGFFRVPAVDWKRTSRRVLALEWIDGIPLTRDEALRDADRVALANCVTRGFLASALDHGVFHADMHEGNMMVLRGEGRIQAGTALGLVDFGLVGRIGWAERRFLAEVLDGFLKRDYARVAQVHFDAGYVPPDRDRGDFAHALRSIGEPIFGVAATEVSMGNVLIRLFETTREFGMHLRPELVLLQKTMVQVEGVARNIDPNHDIWASAKPVVDRWVAREFGPRGVAKQARATIVGFGRRLSRLADLADRLEHIAAQNPPPRPPRSALPGLLWLTTGAAIGAAGVVGVAMLGWPFP